MGRRNCRAEEAGDYSGGNDECHEELDRRLAEGECSRCGKRRAEDSFWCNDCRLTDNPPFVGYPPGAA